MNADHDKQDELQKMLAAKRNAPSPPRALKGFSESVIHRLQKPEPPEELSLREQIAHLIESKPVLVCLSGVVVFGCLAAGLVASLRVAPAEPEKTAINQEDKTIVSPTTAHLGKPVAHPLQATSPAALPALDSPAVVSEPYPVTGARFQPVRATVPPTPAPQSGSK